MFMSTDIPSIEAYHRETGGMGFFNVGGYLFEFGRVLPTGCRTGRRSIVYTRDLSALVRLHERNAPVEKLFVTGKSLPSAKEQLYHS